MSNEENLNFWDLLSDYTLADSYENALRDFIRNTSRWDYTERIRQTSKWISSQLSTQKNELPQVLTQDWLKENRDSLLYSNIGYLRNAQEFYESALRASKEVEPILYYYSLSNLMGFFTRSFVIWQARRLSHGITLELPTSSKKLKVILLKGGFFPRLANTLAILDIPNAFSFYFIDYLPTNSGSRSILIKPNPSQLSILKLKELEPQVLVAYDFEKGFRDMNPSCWRLDFKFVYREASKLLSNLVLIYVGAQLARYHPYLWRKILEGEETTLYKDILKSYREFSRMVIFIKRVFDELKDNSHPGHHWAASAYW